MRLLSQQIDNEMIAVTRSYVKVNQTPYLLQLDLHAEIDFARVRVNFDLTRRLITLELPKVVAAAWPELTSKQDAALLTIRRHEALEERRLFDLNVGL
jgi:DNA-binding GntR family transcriptional regulator